MNQAQPEDKTEEAVSEKNIRSRKNIKKLKSIRSWKNIRKLKSIRSRKNIRKLKNIRSQNRIRKRSRHTKNMLRKINRIWKKSLLIPHRIGKLRKKKMWVISTHIRAWNMNPTV